MVWMESTGGSDGEVRMNDEGEGKDAVFIINWAEKLPHSNGDMAFVGASAPAAMALLAAKSDPRVKCIIANNNVIPRIYYAHFICPRLVFKKAFQSVLHVVYVLCYNNRNASNGSHICVTRFLFPYQCL